MTWISVKDRLPNDLDRVDILINKERRLIECTYTHDAFWYHGFKDEYWTKVTNNVTHWMPLPDLPKK